MLSNAQNGLNVNPGLNCPECNFFIQFSLADLLYKQDFSCPGCGLKLSMNREQSRESMELIQKLYIAHENVNKTKNFEG